MTVKSFYKHGNTQANTWDKVLELRPDQTTMENQSQMADKLTIKERGFVKDYLANGNGTLAALKNYDTKNENTAAVIAHENLRKPKIVKAIGDRLDDNLLVKKHYALLNKMEVITKNNNKTGEIEVIPTGEIDAQAVSKALDMAYKIKSTYAIEKPASVTVNVEELRVTIQQNLANFRTNNQREGVLPQSSETV